MNKQQAFRLMVQEFLDDLDIYLDDSFPLEDIREAILTDGVTATHEMEVVLRENLLAKGTNELLVAYIVQRVGDELNEFLDTYEGTLYV